jgi:hypothetical protein
MEMAHIPAKQIIRVMPIKGLRYPRQKIMTGSARKIRQAAWKAR